LNCEETLHAISAAGLTLIASKFKDTLRISPPEKLTPELVDAIQEHKEEIIEIMREDQRKRENRALKETDTIESERQVFELARQYFGDQGEGKG
jgi:acyl-CoA reductase-like NAD-dependent aldehyde dehydrogenase